MGTKISLQYSVKFRIVVTVQGYHDQGSQFMSTNRYKFGKLNLGTVPNKSLSLQTRRSKRIKKYH